MDATSYKKKPIRLIILWEVWEGKKARQALTWPRLTTNTGATTPPPIERSSVSDGYGVRVFERGEVTCLGVLLTLVVLVDH